MARSQQAHRSARKRVVQRRNANPVSGTTNAKTQRLRTRRRGSGCSSIFVGLIAALLLIGVVIVGFASMVGGSLQEIQGSDPRATPQPILSGGAGEPREVAAVPEEEQEPAPDSASPEEPLPSTTLPPFTMLLLGVDSRGDLVEAVRSDTLIVVHVDTIDQWVSMLSIPRDSMVDIPYIGQGKINTAYTYGFLNAEELYGAGIDPADAGGALAAETIEQFLDIRIDYIAQVDFHGFEQVVNTIGGITVDVPEPLLDAEYPTENFGYERIYIPSGLQIFDGRTALAYARSRHAGSDFDRSCRQQRVLRAMLREVEQRNMFDQIALVPDVLEDAEDSISTTMPVTDLSVLRGLADFARSLSADRILQFSINPSNVQMVSQQGSDIYWNEADIERLVARMLAGPDMPEAPDTALIQVQNGAGVQGLAGRVTAHLGAQGFVMVEAGDAPRIYANTTIIDYTGQPEVRQRLARELDIETAYVQSTPDDDAPEAPENADIVLVVGSDYEQSWTVAPTTTAAPTPVPAAPTGDVPNLPPSCSPDF